MGQTEFIGSAAFISGIIVFCGSIWLLMAVLMGPKLAYWVTATVTLAFVLIMAAVWSYGDPLGPVGTMPSWEQGDAVEGRDVPEGIPGGYPDSDPWHEPDPEDETETERASELENSAQEVLDRELDEGQIDTFPESGIAVVDSESIRLAEQGGETYGAVTFIAAEPTEGEEQVEFTPTVVGMHFDPGYPNRPAHLLLVLTLLLFIGHMFGLGRAERRARRTAEAQRTETA